MAKQADVIINQEEEEDFDELASALAGDGKGLDFVDDILKDGQEDITEKDVPEKTPEEEVDETEKTEEAGKAAEDTEETPAKEEEEAVKTEEGEAEEEEEPAAGEEELSRQELETENAELRQSMRKQSRRMALMESKLERLLKSDEKKTDEDDDIYDEEDDTATPGKEEKLSEMEVLEQELVDVGSRRSEAFGDMIELMALGKDYSDVKEVCTQSRFDDLFEAAAKQKVEQDGGDLDATQLAFEVAVWKMPNPYKYMYDMIRKHHPDFAEPKDKKGSEEEEEKGDKDKKTSVKEPTEEAKKREKELVKAPTSALDIGDGSGGKESAGWTAERIDKMDEEDLEKVPKDIYEKYLRGELDK